MADFLEALLAALVIVGGALLAGYADRLESGPPLSEPPSRPQPPGAPQAPDPPADAGRTRTPGAARGEGPDPNPRKATVTTDTSTAQAPAKPACHLQAGLLMCRQVAESFPGAPLIISTVNGPARSPGYLVPGTPVAELIVLGDGVMAVSHRYQDPGKPFHSTAFDAPFSRDTRHLLDAWVRIALSELPKPGKAVA